jgi:hypothetical protein
MFASNTLLIVDFGSGYARYYRGCRLEKVYKLGSRTGVFLEHDTSIEYRA